MARRLESCAKASIKRLDQSGTVAFTLSLFQHTAFSRLKEIFNTPHYVERRVDQSVVEIVIARITAAIRETGCIETYSAELVDVLDSCLNHPMTVLNSDGELVDSPHCKIASDLLSSLFLVGVIRI
ncbi:hypothetical protein ANCDUO_05828 [Ancylostoma duodenale]|uniref:Uncharacterized protein n=1 Tax=Ancylostoma duodenale TaxID=51022 RepID=A0A0C2GRE8_9BILA|nr:hypothetical protein ANCDUO_05828 [Ancylostoma duodenale]